MVVVVVVVVVVAVVIVFERMIHFRSIDARTYTYIYIYIYFRYIYYYSWISHGSVDTVESVARERKKLHREY